MYKKVIAVLFVISFIPVRISFSQNVSDTNFIIQLVKIKQTENKKTVEYEFKDDLNKILIFDDSVSISPNKYKYKAGITDLKSITLVGGSNFGKGAFAGSILGFVGGFIGSFGFLDRNNVFGGIAGGLLLALPVAGIFGLLGSWVQTEVEYGFGDYSISDKKALLIKILRDNRYKK